MYPRAGVQRNPSSTSNITLSSWPSLSGQIYRRLSPTSSNESQTSTPRTTEAQRRWDYEHRPEVLDRAYTEFKTDWPVAGAILAGGYSSVANWNSGEAERYRVRAYEVIETELRREKELEKMRIRELRRDAAVGKGWGGWWKGLVRRSD